MIPTKHSGGSSQAGVLFVLEFPGWLPILLSKTKTIVVMAEWNSDSFHITILNLALFLFDLEHKLDNAHFSAAACSYLRTGWFDKVRYRPQGSG